MNDDNGHTGILIDKSARPEEKATPPAPAKDKKLVEIVREASKKHQEHRQPFEKTWFVNLAMLMSQHWFVWNDHTRTFDIAIRSASEGIRLTANLILPWWRRAVARLTARAPGVVVSPATTDQGDVEKARLSTKVLNSEFERLKIKAIQKRIAGWVLSTGNCFVHPRWDAWAGPLMYEDLPLVTTDPMTGEQVQEVDPETGEPLTERVPVTDDKGRHLHVGATVYEIRTPFEGGPDPRAKSGQEADWWIWKSTRSLQWIRDNYGEIANLVKPEEGLRANSVYEKQARQIVGVYGNTEDPADTGMQEIFPDSAEVVEYWEKPSGKHANGRLIVVAGEVVLFNGENPYTRMIREGLNFPFVHYLEVLVNGRCLGSSTIEHVGPLNRAYNRRRSQQEENAAVMGRPKVLVPHGCITEGSFNQKAGERISYRPGPRGEKPEYIHPPSTAGINDVAIIASQRDMQDVMSEHDSTKGIMPSANAPAEAVKLLMQGDETVFGETQGHFEDGHVMLAQMTVCNAMQFWSEERLVRAAGEDDTLVAGRISGAMLDGEGDGSYCDVKITTGSTLRLDPEKNREKAMAYIKELGVLDPVQHRREVMKILDDPALDPVMREDRLDESRAHKENELMEQGLPVQASDYEGHNIHLQVLIRYMKSEKFLQLPPETQELFFQHKAEHEFYRVQAASQLNAEAAQVAMAGVPAGAESDGGDSEPGAAPADSSGSDF